MSRARKEHQSCQLLKVSLAVLRANLVVLPDHRELDGSASWIGQISLKPELTIWKLELAPLRPAWIASRTKWLRNWMKSTRDWAYYMTLPIRLRLLKKPTVRRTERAQLWQLAHHHKRQVSRQNHS